MHKIFIYIYIYIAVEHLWLFTYDTCIYIRYMYNMLVPNYHWKCRVLLFTRIVLNPQTCTGFKIPGTGSVFWTIRTCWFNLKKNPTDEEILYNLRLLLWLIYTGYCYMKTQEHVCNITQNLMRYIPYMRRIVNHVAYLSNGVCIFPCMITIYM